MSDDFRDENADILASLDGLLEHFESLERRMADPSEMIDQAAYTRLLREHSGLAGAGGAYRQLTTVLRELADAHTMAEEEADPEMRELAEAEIERLTQRRNELFEQVKRKLVASDPENQRDAIMEIRAGTGGDEAALFAGDLLRMYEYYVSAQGWRLEVMDASPSDMGGFKEATLSIRGKGAFGRLKFESGGHRVQRVPATESQGRIHTSAATVAVMPEVEMEDIEIDEQDVRVDRMRSSGPGGQSVNKTSSAIRLTHEPTGTVVSMQDEKSQHKNLAKAWKILRARIYEKQQAEKQAKRDSLRRSLIGSGDRSQRIRTYNFPQNRLTDHRIGLTLYSLDRVMEGQLDELFDALQAYEEEQQLLDLAEHGFGA